MLYCFNKCDFVCYIFKTYICPIPNDYPVELPLRPTIELNEFLRVISKAELAEIVSAVEKALAETYESIGTGPFIPQFRSIYSSCLFPNIWGQLEALARTNPAWEVKKNRMTFILVKRGVCQFHFYKGRHNASFKPTSKRQTAIVQGELYGDLENLPSIIFQHFSDRANSQLLGFHALFFERGKLQVDYNVGRQTADEQQGVKFDITVNSPIHHGEPAEKLGVRFRPKKKSQPAAEVKKQQGG